MHYRRIHRGSIVSAFFPSLRSASKVPEKSGCYPEFQTIGKHEWLRNVAVPRNHPNVLGGWASSPFTVPAPKLPSNCGTVRIPESTLKRRIQKLMMIASPFTPPSLTAAKPPPYNSDGSLEGGRMRSLGVPELLVILAIGVLLFGGKKIPEVAKGLGEGIRNFKNALKGDEKPPEDKPKQA